MAKKKPEVPFTTRTEVINGQSIIVKIYEPQEVKVQAIAQPRGLGHFDTRVDNIKRNHAKYLAGVKKYNEQQRLQKLKSKLKKQIRRQMRQKSINNC